MFQNTAGLRLTLYLGAVDMALPASSAKAGAQNPETAFRYSGDGPVPSFYWVDQGFGYAPSGAVVARRIDETGAAGVPAALNLGLPTSGRARDAFQASRGWQKTHPPCRA